MIRMPSARSGNAILNSCPPENADQDKSVFPVVLTVVQVLERVRVAERRKLVTG
jgi:hypothetical protein